MVKKVMLLFMTHDLTQIKKMKSMFKRQLQKLLIHLLVDSAVLIITSNSKINVTWRNKKMRISAKKARESKEFLNLTSIT